MDDAHVEFIPPSEFRNSRVHELDPPAVWDTPRKVATVDLKNNEAGNALFQVPGDRNGNEHIPPVEFPSNDNETFMSTADFANANDPSQWDFLLTQGSRSQAAHVASKWERESLYLKFDPLVKPSNEHAFAVPAAPVSNRNQTIDHPVNELQAPRHTSYSEQTAPVVDFHKEKEMLTKKIEESKLKFQAEMQKKSDRLKEMENSIKHSSKELELQQKSGHKIDHEKIMTDLEAQISKFVRDITNARAETASIEDSRELASEDLRQAELIFSDLHGKYEKTKKLLSNFKENEQVLNNRYEAMRVKLDNRDGKLKRLQETAEDKLRSIKQDFGSCLKAEEMEINRLRAQSRKVELHLSTLEKDVEQKQIENKKLSQLCDDLIKGQGRP